MKRMKILCLGDVVGPRSIDYLRKNISAFKQKNSVDIVIANGENASVGNGLNKSDAVDLLSSGVDVITSGNHIWQKYDIQPFLDECEYIVRPANYPFSCPGKGSTIYNYKGIRILIMNVCGVEYGENLLSPFDSVEKMLCENEGKYDISVLDVHAETTSEKIALARYFDSRISIIFGTHTHVQTNDAVILPGGTAYITDLGMTGPIDGILGVKSELVIKKLRSRMPVKFQVADGEIKANGALFTLDNNFKAQKVEAIVF